ncbi:PucR family transcriptional regulator [Klugiella xanthotipulae]
MTQRQLLDHAPLGLTLLVDPETEAGGRRIDSVIQWVHGTDLLDPTPFLSPDNVLLTTGSQFDDATATVYEDYVRRLADSNIRGLGFGTDVSRRGTPDPLIAACIAHQLPLFEVPYRTPFIAIVRYAADLISREKHARDAWSLSAQRAVTLAALRPDGLRASLRELSRQLTCWVALYDTAGFPTQVFPSTQRDEALSPATRTETRRILAAGTRSSARLAGETDSAHQVSLQTLGASGHLRGVLAVGGSSTLDYAAQSVVTGVVALASLALEQNHALSIATRHLRTGTLGTLLSGNLAAARGAARQLWGDLPSEPLTVITCVVPPERDTPVTEALSTLAARTGGGVFYADHVNELVILAADRHVDDVHERLAAHGIPSGGSRSGDYAEITTLLAQAEQSLQRAFSRGTRGHVSFQDLRADSILSLLDKTEARDRAEAFFEPVFRIGSTEAETLLSTAAEWLEHNGQWAPAAATLGIHRHTLKGRIELLEQLLGRDLSQFSARAELWTALRCRFSSPRSRKTGPSPVD